jgi:pimeloyl-ACP methyl ester carboxylesterase/DNA-binding winged helix-turn-helix (wHTH) protein
LATNTPQNVCYRFAQFEFDLVQGRLLCAGQERKLRPKAFELLRLLIEGRGRLFSKDEILQTLWPGLFASEDSLTQAVSDVRAALGSSAAEIVVTVPKRGYRFGVTVDELAGATVHHRVPEVRYAQSGEIRIAYQVVGEGPVDLVYVPGWVSHLEYGWESPLVSAFCEGLASFSRLILFDKRGTGLSDRAYGLPTIEERMDDVRAVMDAAGSKRAAIFAMSEGGGMAVAFAATYPQRVRSLVLFGIFAKRVWSPDYPWAPTPAQRQVYYDAIERGWGGPVSVEDIAPSLAQDAAFCDWWATYQRRSASPAAALALARMNTAIDVCHLLPKIEAPTLVMNRIGDQEAKIEEARYIAARIPQAEFLALPGEEHLIYADDQEAVIRAAKAFILKQNTET